LKKKSPILTLLLEEEQGLGVDVDNPNQSKIQKVIPEDAKYDPIRQKEFFKNAVEMF
jgi:hypothetical protein